MTLWLALGIVGSHLFPVTARTRWLVGGAVLLGLLAAASGVLVAFRAPVVEAAGERYLAARGFAGIDLAVEDVGLAEATLAVRGQAPGLPAIDRLQLRYRPFEIVAGRVREIVVSGLSLDLDLRQEPPPFLRLAGPSGGGTAGPGPRIVLQQATATVRGLAEVPLHLEVDGVLDLEAAPRHADLSLRLKSEEAKLEASVRVVIESGGSAHALWLAEPLRLLLADASPQTLRRLGLTDADRASRLGSPLRLTVSGATGRPAAQMTAAERGGWRLDSAITVDAQAETANVRARLLSSTDHDRGFRTLDGEVSLQEGRVRIPDAEVELRALAGWVRFGGQPLSASLRARARHDVPVPAVAQVDLTLDLLEKPDHLEAFGSARWSESATIPFKARYAFAPARAEATLGPVTLAFGQSLQPKDLSLHAASLGAEGPLEAQARLTWRPGGALAAQGALTARGVSLRTPDFAVEGLAGTVTASRLWPPETPVDQTLTAAKLVAGVPLEDVRMRFRLVGTERRTAIEIAEASARLSEGTLKLQNAVIDTAASVHALDVQVQGLSLSQLTSNLGVEGLQGEGTLSGRLPLRLGAQGLAVESGELADTGAGVIRLDVGQARKMLEGQGQDVGLVVQALENFHYDSLRLGIERPFAGDLTLKVRMAGKNPDVLEGHPFNFNISLSGNPDPILSALKEGRRLSGDLLKGAVGQ